MGRKLDEQGLDVLVREINKSVNTKVNTVKVDLSPYPNRDEVRLINDATVGKVNEVKESLNSFKKEVNIGKINDSFSKQGGVFEGVVKAQNNASYSTPQIRNIIISTEEPTNEQGENGDIWVIYEE